MHAGDNATSALDVVRSKLQIFDQFGGTASDLAENFNTGAGKLDPQHV